MRIIRRRISVLARQLHSAREGRRILRRFHEWREMQWHLPSPHPLGKTLLIIRLDDIGDYLLFRNHLPRYKESPRWKDHAITLLGNASWKELFPLLDGDSVDETIWVDKGRYLTSCPYRLEIWRQLRGRGFETVIAPSCTRPLLLDDLCMLAAAPVRKIGSVNTYVHSSWNRASDRLYTELFTRSDALTHEFRFNADFTAWVCGIRCQAGHPHIECAARPPMAGPYILCFVGANTRSKRWPVKRWIEFIELHRRHSSGKVVLAGAGQSEIKMAKAVQERTGAENIAGTVSLSQLLAWVAGAAAVLTNDTMAAHLSASCSRPTVIIANGVNYLRFTDYGQIGMGNVGTVYPDVFDRRRRRVGPGPYPYSSAVTADIESIEAAVVFENLEKVLAHGPGAGLAIQAADDNGSSGQGDRE